MDMQERGLKIPLHSLPGDSICISRVGATHSCSLAGPLAHNIHCVRLQTLSFFYLRVLREHAPPVGGRAKHPCSLQDSPSEVVSVRAMNTGGDARVRQTVLRKRKSIFIHCRQSTVVQRIRVEKHVQCVLLRRIRRWWKRGAGDYNFYGESVQL